MDDLAVPNTLDNLVRRLWMISQRLHEPCLLFEAVWRHTLLYAFRVVWTLDGWHGMPGFGQEQPFLLSAVIQLAGNSEDTRTLFRICPQAV